FVPLLVSKLVCVVTKKC
uniref:Brevinin-1AVb n=2 Tax=Rana arvalis TaxID=156871 RepID=BR1B_RANAR|nr:RecName: Full=Brevinin-1AVb [Rana arvalis]